MEGAVYTAEKLPENTRQLEFGKIPIWNSAKLPFGIWQNFGPFFLADDAEIQKKQVVLVMDWEVKFLLIKKY